MLGYYEGNLVCSAKELALSMPEFNALLAQGWEVLVSTTRGRDDLITGSEFGDRLYGWGGNDSFIGGLESDFYKTSTPVIG